MLTNTHTAETEVEHQIVKLLVNPLSDDLTEHVTSSLSGNKLYLTRVDELNLLPLVVKESTPLFTNAIEDENQEQEDNEEKKSVKINPSFKHENSNIIQSGKDYVSAIEGLFIIVNNCPKIIPISYDGSGDVRVSDDSMYVYVDVYPSIDNNPIPTLEDIVNKILSLGVLTEIKSNHLAEKLKDVEENKRKWIEICLSEGKQPIHGKDGRLENCTKKKENFENFNFSEFHRVNPVISVKEGETIALLHPPTEGEPGYNILKQKVDPIPGKEFKIQLGKNTRFSDEDEIKIIATADGFVNMDDDSISVTDTFTVRGDIDFKSGNIVSKGSLKVIGNVKNEFTLSLSKNIDIGGYVGDAFVEAGENVKIHGGFLGKGKGIVKAKGDVDVRFVENQKLYCRGSLSILKDTLNAQLFVKGSIISKTGRAAIIGGHAIAGDSIEVNSLGNSSESETIIEVGFDYLKRNSIMDNKEEQKKLREKLEEVDRQIFEFAKMKRLNTSAGEKVKVLANQHKELVAQIEEIKVQNLKITNEIYVPSDSKIVITGTIYPGVKIGINGRFMLIKKPLRTKTFILSKDNEVMAY